MHREYFFCVNQFIYGKSNTIISFSYKTLVGDKERKYTEFSE